MEKVINEFKVIETDDGFRIEIKGDKEAIRRMMRGFGPGFFRGKKRHFGGPDFDFGFGPGPRFWAGFGDWCGSWVWEEEDQEDQPKAA
jgi:hypothetical protein